jgi:hypothetical protein
MTTWTTVQSRTSNFDVDALGGRVAQLDVTGPAGTGALPAGHRLAAAEEQVEVVRGA